MSAVYNFNILSAKIDISLQTLTMLISFLNFTILNELELET